MSCLTLRTADVYFFHPQTFCLDIGSIYYDVHTCHSMIGYQYYKCSLLTPTCVYYSLYSFVRYCIFGVPQHSVLHFPPPTHWCRVFQSRVFHPCIFDGAGFSFLAFSVAPATIVQSWRRNVQPVQLESAAICVSPRSYFLVPVTKRAASVKTRSTLPLTLLIAPARMMLQQSNRNVTNAGRRETSLTAQSRVNVYNRFHAISLTKKQTDTTENNHGGNGACGPIQRRSAGTSRTLIAKSSVISIETVSSSTTAARL